MSEVPCKLYYAAFSVTPGISWHVRMPPNPSQVTHPALQTIIETAAQDWLEVKNKMYLARDYFLVYLYWLISEERRIAGSHFVYEDT